MEQALEKHYTVNEIAEAWKLHPGAVRRLFAKEPGVLAVSTKGVRPGVRQKHTYRIPESVLARVSRQQRVA